MSLDFVPDLEAMQIDGALRPGRQVRALRSAQHPPVAWVTDWGAFATPGLNWASLSARADSIGTQPFLFTGLDGGPARPWDDGDLGDPEAVTAIEELDSAKILRRLWDGKAAAGDGRGLGSDVPGTGMGTGESAPFGTQFPGPAPAVDDELDPDLIWLALQQYGPGTRLGLVPVDRSADILPRTGWRGAGGRGSASELAAVLRSWEDRFGARLLEVGFNTIRVLVSRPPQSPEATLAVAAEHFALCDASQGCSAVRQIAGALMANPFWDLRWKSRQ